jgi:hypothetical protein
MFKQADRIIQKECLKPACKQLVGRVCMSSNEWKMSNDYNDVVYVYTFSHHQHLRIASKVNKDRYNTLLLDMTLWSHDHLCLAKKKVQTGRETFMAMTSARWPPPLSEGEWESGKRETGNADHILGLSD